ncbi:MAG: metallophosphoesterase [Phenylobacterium zucineum]|nr:MAG: metallophosphoesterase [Phenylobacterium zucineum]
MTAFRLAHLSDLQLPPPPLPFRWSDMASKRLLSRFAWRRKRRRHIQDVLDAIAADVRALAPDHVAITGDVINFSTPEEFEAARAWLSGLGDPDHVTVSPGNHDALSARGAPRDFAPWRPWLSDGDGGAFPYLRVRGPVALVNLSSAVPTALHLAQGSLGAGQVEAARALLKTTGEQGLYRVVLVHHPVASDVVAGRKELVDADALRAVLAEAGAELVLHGHAHEALLTTVRGPAGAIPVMGVPAASTPAGGKGQPARWNEIAITRDGGGFRTHVTARGVTTALTVEPIGRFTLT